MNKTKNSYLVKKTFVTLVNLLGLDTKIKHYESNGTISLDIISKESGRLIGRNGSYLTSLNLILSKIFFNYNKNFPKIILNVNSVNNTESKNAVDDNLLKKIKDRKEKVAKELKENVYNVYVNDDSFVEVKKEKKPSEKKIEKCNDFLEKECDNAVKELKRWGDDVLLPPLKIEDSDKALGILKKDYDIVGVIDEKKSFSDKKRIRISLNKKEGQ